MSDYLCSECNQGNGHESWCSRRVRNRAWGPVANKPQPIVTPPLQPMETAPRDGTYVILFGRSGYITTPWRCEVCHYDAEYRPRQPWVTYNGDSFRDSGLEPIGWLPLPTGKVTP